MAERKWPTREDLQDLKKRGVVFGSSLCVRAVCFVVLLGTSIFCWSWVPQDVVPGGAEDLPGYARAVGKVGIALSAAVLVASLLVTLILNGFVFSVDLLASRRRVKGSSGFGAGIVCAALGACCAYALIYGFSGELFLLLRADGHEEVRSGVAALGIEVCTASILGGIFVAILVACVARLRFLFVNRVPPGLREQ